MKLYYLLFTFLISMRLCAYAETGPLAETGPFIDNQYNKIVFSKETANRPVLLFFVNDSEKSIEYLSKFTDVYSEYAGTSLKVFTLISEKTPDEALAFQGEQFIPYPIFGDKDKAVSALYKIKEYPQMVILDKDKKLVYKGPYPDDIDKFKRELNKHLLEKFFFIKARQFEYEPNIIAVNEGDTVFIKLVTEDVAHGLYIDGYELETKSIPIEDGVTVGTITFVANKTGRFSMRCSETCAYFHPYMYGWLRVKSNSRFYVAVFLALALGGFFIFYFSKEKNGNRILGLFPVTWRFELTQYSFVQKMLKNRWRLLHFLAVIFTTLFFTVIVVSSYVGKLSAGNFNFGIIFVWITWFVLLIMLFVPFFSRIFCGVCPLPLFGILLQRHAFINVSRRVFGLNKKFPKALKNMWLVNFLFLGITFFNGYFTTIPIATFIMLAVLIVGATIMSFVYEKRSFCRYVCPIGGFQGLYSNAATIEIRSKDVEVCHRIKKGEDYTFENGIAACRLSCPAGVDASSYVALINKGQYERALEVIREAMPFPGVCGRICPAPCEQECSRKKVDKPIAISALKRFVADYVGYSKEKIKDFVPSYKEKIAVVGSGPGGLTCAYYLAKSGYAVTVYEALPVIGGMLKVGLPGFHLPKDIVDKEIEHIKNTGVNFVTNTAVGKDISFDSLRKDYQAVFIAVGASKSRRLKLEGEDLEGVETAIGLLRRVNMGEKVEIGKKVVVFGGGKTAIDVARASLRLGAEDVTCLEIRAEDDLLPIEKQAEEEGVKIKYLTAPVRIVGSDGRANAVLCTKMRQGAIDEATGKLRYVSIKGTENLISADTIIVAVGQYSDISFLPEELNISKRGTIAVDPGTMATNIPGVFAGGDVVSGPTVFVNGVMQGRKAAITIERFLKGEILKPVSLYPIDKQVDDLPLDSVEHRDRIEPEHLPLEGRLKNFNEVELVFTEKMAREEAGRCLGCGSCGNCYRGNENGYGCPWMEMPFRMRRNTYCGMCLECFKTCPEDNMAINLRPPAVDVLVDDKRGIDEAWKSFIMLGCAVVFYVFMMGPWGFLKDWQRGKTFLGLLKYMAASGIFTLLIVPAIYGIFVSITKRLNNVKEIPYKKLFLNYSYSLIPLGLLTWIAFCFAFLLPSGSYVIGVISDPFNWGWNLFGTAGFPWTPFLTYWIPYLQAISLLFGMVFSIDVGTKISRQMFDNKKQAVINFLPIAGFIVLWTIIMLWLFLW